MSKEKDIAATPTDAKERAKAIETAMSQIEKAFGKGSIMKLGAESKLDVQAVSTGSLSLDLALGVGGVPKGRITEIYGPESGGKTTLALSIVAQSQKAGGTCAFIDAEHALDPVYARSLGVNTDELLVSQPDNGEQALEIMELLVRSGAVDVVVVDSVAALTPRAEIEGEMGDSLPGLQARLMSQALRKLTAILSKTGTAAIFINQVREKIGVMYGNPETTTGGRALKFYSSVRLDVRKIGQPVKMGNDAIGNTVKVKTVKNKVAPPFKEVELTLMYGKGFDQLSDLVTLASDMEIIKKAGSFYSYNDERIGQGKEKAIAYIAERPEMEAEIRTRVLGAIKEGRDPLAAVPTVAE
ncbi:MULTISPECIES: recombinase RecA [Deinococcus]|jgi:recombination protein RecA|uniref:Protein RecA n=2 Tax=Deinococcus soli (ex Cha et al. 2016) TaxID=1309411 RepID=A0AAE3XFF4_9DEIO|nr:MULTISPECIES: recombinase RecA [Deinococcus]MDK2014414.1 recombinase RecA [Deinococcus sp. 43]MDR6221100.1 recombination protein RecA [Deinococcus soli (ex Cha et al. 2016)]MDR6331033.1 recombination protein RecA [Deinococcus soli (ex Cha et al. 2016)]MDR6754229.1 recombination protein RecA [Deinococcus soli (ex Cha et al. 2016)]GGB76186.1 protein RecA [Deinococcus soli (ex Cha et al. 2016)]